jgi:tetratricopeptide (TPR) repeat protein
MSIVTGSSVRVAAAFFVWASLVGLAGRAAADDESVGREADAARAAFDLGVEHYEARRYERAAVEFRRAHELNPSWRIQYNIGQCEAVLKRYGLAIEAFEVYLAAGGDEVQAERRDEVLAELDRLRKLIGDLDVHGPDGLEVRIDGRLRGKTPLGTPIRVTAGLPHALEIRRGDRLVKEREVTVGGGQKLVVELAEEEIEQSPDEVETEVDGSDSEGADAAVESGNEGLHPAFFWTALGTTAALGVGTGVLAGMTRSRIDEVKADRDDDSKRKDAESAQLGGRVLLGLTAAAAVTTAVLSVFTEFGGEGPEDGAATVTAFGGAGAAGVAVTGSF